MTGMDVVRKPTVQAALCAAAVIPALIDQATTDASAVAWLALGTYAAIVVVALWAGRRRPLTAFCVIFTVLAVTEVAMAAAEVELSSLAVLPPAFALYAVGAQSPRP